MGDLKTPWSNPVYPDTSDLSGDLATSRGNDPNGESDNGGGAGLKNFWDDKKQAMSENGVGVAESSNSVSGLPALPNRFQPTEEPPELPDLTTRSPGTIDKK